MPGTERQVKVSYPFSATRGTFFWLMFVPGLASVNGWNACPEAIPASAFVRCNLIEVAQPAKSSAWISVAIDDVVTMADLERRFPPVTCPLPPAERHQSLSRTRFHGWEAIEASSEGDVGVWLLARHSLHKVHLLVLGKWSFHEDTIDVGNVELTEEQWASVCDGMKLR